MFTALTCQEPGKFLKDYRTDFPMGHLVVAVYRSWYNSNINKILNHKKEQQQQQQQHY